MTGSPSFWTQRGLLGRALLPASAIFFLISWVRRTLYGMGLLPQIRLGVPVIIVGNLVAGGTGKTPVVIALACALRAAGYRPGVVSRGYGGSATGSMSVSAATDPSVAGDEPVLIAQRTGCPVWVGKRRGAAGAALLTTNPECDVILSDDGLQHHALDRDVSIAVFDERGAGNGWLLPSGPLREPLSRVDTVDFVLYQGTEGAPVTHSHAFPFWLDGGAFHRLDDATQIASAADFSGKKVAAMAGIANPGRFFAYLSGLGINATGHAFPDHHPYIEGDLDFKDAEAILMTEKDAVKCISFARPNCWVLRVHAELPPAFIAGVLEKLDGRTTT